MDRSIRTRVRSILLLALVGTFLSAAFGVSALLRPSTALAAQTIPYKINFQGRLTDNNGNILSDGLYNIKFRLFDAASAGTNKWEGDRVFGTFDNRVQITSGLFNIQFGDTSLGDPALSPSLFSGTFPLYLEVELPTPATSTCATNGCAVFTEGAMTPRQPLASAAYAFSADTLDGLDATAFGQLASTNTFTNANVYAPGATSAVALTVKASTAGSVNSLEVFDSTGTRQAYFDAAASLNVAKTIQPTATNASDLGTSGLTFRTGYFGTSVVAPLVTSSAALSLTSNTSNTITVDSGTTGNVNVGTDTVNSKTINIGPTATNTSATTINIGTNVAGTQNIDLGSTGSGNAAAGTNINLQGGTGTNAIVLGTNGAGAIGVDTGTTGPINVGTGTTAAKTITIGPTATNTNTTTYQLGVNTAGAQAISIGGTASAANANTSVVIQGGTGATALQIGPGNIAHGIQIAAGGTNTTQTVVIGSGTGAVVSTVTLNGGNITTTNNQSGIIIGSGFSTSDTNLVGLTLDSTTTFTETASTCTTSTNDGTLYYNSAQASSTQGGSMAIRICTNGNWEDLVSTAGLGLMLYGVVPDSGNNPGDLVSTTTSGVSGPCKVSWASATTVTVAPCIAYSGGRKVVVASTTLTTTNGTAGNYQHVCLTGTNNAPALTTSAAESTGQPSFSVGSPVLCLADIAFAAANNTISQIFDVRVFTTSTKELVSSAAALGLGWPACPSGQQATTCTAAVGQSVMGVVAATNGAVGAGGVPNVILVTGGPTLAKPNLTAVVAGDVVGTVATANRLTATILPTGTLGTAFDSNLGIARNSSPATACTTTASAANCNYQLFFDQQKR